MVTIVQQNEPVLRKIAEPVPVSEIKSPRIAAMLKDMRQALDSEYDGVGLAAPQIGKALRVFIISDLVFRHEKKIKSPEPNILGQNAMQNIDAINHSRHLVYINPEIISSSKDKKNVEEGCLSVRPLYGFVRRASKVTVRAYDENGEIFERGASGLLAQVFQHEIDHLNGTLFIDKAKNIHEMPEEEQERQRNTFRKIKIKK